MGIIHPLTAAQETLTAPAVSVERFDPTPLLRAGTRRLEQPEVAVAAIGLALQGVNVVATPVNLIASRQREDRVRHIYRMALIASSVSAIAILGFGIGTMLELRNQRAKVLQQLEQRQQLYQTRRPEIRALLQQQQHMQHQLDQLQQVAQRAPLLVNVISQVVKQLPDDIWLVKLEGFRNDRVVGTSSSPAEVTDGLLEGRAKSFQAINQLIEHLKTLPEMSTVKLVSTTSAPDPVSGKDVIAFIVQFQRQSPSS